MGASRFVYGPTGTTYTHHFADGRSIETDEPEFELLDADAAEVLLTWPETATRRELLTLAGIPIAEIEEFDDLDQTVGIDVFLGETLERFPAWENASAHFDDGRLHRLASTAAGTAGLLGGGGSTMAGWSATIVGTLEAFEHVAAQVDPDDAIIERDDELVHRARARIGA